MKTAAVAILLLAASLGAAAADRSTELDQAYQNLVAAQRALEEAKERREQIEEPEPGERIGTAKGASRLLPQYFERQRTAERDLIAAEQRYDRALERWKRLR
jgi:hypothetical protein